MVRRYCCLLGHRVVTRVVHSEHSYRFCERCGGLELNGFKVHKRYRFFRWDRRPSGHAGVRWRWVRVLGWELVWQSTAEGSRLKMYDWWFFGPYCRRVFEIGLKGI